MDRPLRVLITSITATGHMNAVSGFGDFLKKKGHTVIFAQHESFRNLAEIHGFLFEPFKEELGPFCPSVFRDWVKGNFKTFRMDGIERWKHFNDEDCESIGIMMQDFPNIDRALTEILTRLKDIDVVVGDFVYPFVFYRNMDIIFIPFHSPNPLGIFKNGVPAGSGFNTKETTAEMIEQHTEIYNKCWSRFEENFKKWLTDSGCKELADQWTPLTNYIDIPIHFGLYHYPEEIDYHEFLPHKGKWMRLDSCVREPDCENFEIPQKLRRGPGKLIFFSLGSLASLDLKLMQEIIDTLKDSPHRFIVSTGADGFQLKLYDNMVGEGYVNQIKVIQAVDLVITHGGNNTLMETLYFGKPMIVIPYFFDQLDNAQRVEEKGLGCRINSWNFSSEYLLKAIEHILVDKNIRNNVKRVSDSMRRSKSCEQATKMIEELVAKRRQRQNAHKAG